MSDSWTKIFRGLTFFKMLLNILLFYDVLHE